MPQFDPSTFASQIVWLLITFTALYFLMSRIVIPRIAEVMEERSERIADDLERAETLRQETQTVIQNYETALERARTEAGAMLSGAQHEIDRTATERTAQFEADLDTKMREADARITQAKTEALKQVRDIAGEITSDITVRLAGEKPDSDRIQAEIDRQLNEAA